MRFPILLTMLSLTLSCSGDKADTADTSGEAAFAPMEGPWSWSNSGYTLDECGMEASFPVAVIEAIVWTLTLTDDGFELSTTSADPLICTLSGMEAHCESTQVTDITEWPADTGIEGDPDVTTTAENVLIGTFVDAYSGTGAASTVAICEGVDCEVYLEALGVVSPCSTEFSGDFSMGM